MNLSRCAILLFAVVVITSHAAETNLTITVDGVTYSNVTFGTVTPASVSIFHSAGIARLPLAKLPPELQQRFGYDAKKSAEWQRAEQQATAAQAAAQESAKRRAEWLKNNVVNIGGVVIDVIEGKGVILSNELFVDAYIAAGGTDRSLMRTSNCFLVCDTRKMVNGSKVRCSAYPDGTYTYTTVMGASRKLPRWVYYGPTDNSKEGTMFSY